MFMQNKFLLIISPFYEAGQIHKFYLMETALLERYIFMRCPLGDYHCPSLYVRK
jgi:hypothetical protein